MNRKSTLLLFVLMLLLTTAVFPQIAAAEDLPGDKPLQKEKKKRETAAACPAPAPRAILAGDSWAQYMWDDNSHNDIFDRYGHADKLMISRSLDSDPGPGYGGPEYAISGSEARQWVNAADYPWIANMLADLNANPGIDTLVLSVGGNDVLAGKSDGGWYKDMDLDVPGSEDALFAVIETNTWTILNAALNARPGMEALISSYEYPNFDVEFGTCWIYACPKREDLSRDPNNDLITNAELNGMMVTVEQRRMGWANSDGRIGYDNSVGLMHYYYGDGVSPPGVHPYPGQTPPDYLPFPGGNPVLPSLRDNFRIIGDPIHLDYDGYQYKIGNQMQSYFLPKFRGTPDMTFFSQGGGNDGWTDGSNTGTNGMYLGDDGTSVWYRGILSFDTAALPPRAVPTAASLYLIRNTLNGYNPFEDGDLGLPMLDVVGGSFGAPHVEASDATAVADAVDVGCYYGSVVEDDYAMRVDVTADGVSAINPDGLTQFRFYFEYPDWFQDEIIFHDGDATLAAPQIEYQVKTSTITHSDGSTEVVSRTVAALPLPGLADYMGTNKPFLDVDYCLLPDTAVLSIAPAYMLNWTAADAVEYEVWNAANDPYFMPSGDCASNAACVLTSNTAVGMQGIADPANNHAYFIVGRNDCGDGASASISNRVGEFDFPIQPGTAVNLH